MTWVNRSAACSLGQYANPKVASRDAARCESSPAMMTDPYGRSGRAPPSLAQTTGRLIGNRAIRPVLAAERCHKQE